MGRAGGALLACAMLAACGTGETPAPPPATSACTGIAGDAMVWVPGGSFTMGDDPRYPEEGPPRQVTVKGFWMDAHEVTNGQFAAFVAATGYVTMAERPPPALASAPPEMRLPGSAIFAAPEPGNPAWWRWAVGAEWRHPSGPGTDITGQDLVPVVQVAYEDALVYAKWAGKDLPSEDQWEYAARGGSAAALPEPVDGAGKPQANYWQGVFPAKDTGEDGFTARAPVGCFSANAYGLHDMIGNVWEWTATTGSRADAAEPVGVIKGGSFLCAANYCARYRPAARQFQERSLGTDHIGFRLIDTRRPPPRED